MKFVCGIFLVLMQSLCLLAGIPELENLFEQDNFEELQRLLPAQIAATPNDPVVLFLQGFTHDDPETAVTFYKRVVDEFPTSTYADNALLRLGQYSYFKGDYATARRHYSHLFRSFPESDLKDDAQYLYCQCILAQGKVDSAKLFLKAFVQNTKRSPYVDAAILDIEELGGLPQRDLGPPAESKNAKRFTIQVASYKKLSDAQNAAHKLSRVFPSVQVGERTLGNTSYYHVLIGNFESKSKAADYARLYIKPHLSEYKVIELTK